MNFCLPDVPQNLTASFTAAKVEERMNELAITVYNKCLVEISKQKFPCAVLLEKDGSHLYLPSIQEKIQRAGYNVNITTAIFTESNGRDDYTVERIAININNPLIKNLVTPKTN